MTTDPIRLAPAIPAGQLSVRPNTLNLLSRLSVGQKLALSAAIFAVPIMGLTYLAVSRQQAEVNALHQEQRALPFIQTANQLQHDVQDYASAAMQYQHGGGKNRDALAARVEQSIKAYTQAVKADPLLAKAAHVSDVQNQWSTIRAEFEVVNALDLVNTAAIEGNSIAKDVLMGGIDEVGNETGLVLDTRLDSYYVQDYLSHQLPDLAFQLATARLAGGKAPKEQLTPVAADQITKAIPQIQTYLEEATGRYQYALKANPGLKAQLTPKFEAMQTDINAAVSAMNQFLSGTELPNYDALVQSALASTRAFSKASEGVLGQSLRERSDSESRQLLIELLAIAGLLALAAGLLYVVARAITRPLTQLAGASQRLAEGDLSVQVPVTSHDEIGTVSGAFNEAVEQLRAGEVKNERERQEAAQLQQNVGAFLDVTMDIAEGDLTKRGRVTEDVLGNVVDSINLMAEELSGVLQNVKQASQAVNDGSLSVSRTTDQIASGTQTTAQEAARVSAQVQQVTGAIREVAANAQQSAEAARQALAASQQGQQAVLDTLSGMQNIRREVQGVAKRIKSLGERSLEIQEIVDTISRLSRQTNLLALNAAIEAAGAGESGSRFAIVADEVRKLADSSAQATARIAGLIRGVQSEINEVTASVEDGTREVESGYRVAGSAGERLRDIAALSEQSAALAERISEATGSQVERVEQVDGAVRQIAQVAEASSASVQTGRAAAEQLRLLAAQLDQALARFRLA